MLSSLFFFNFVEQLGVVKSKESQKILRIGRRKLKISEHLIIKYTVINIMSFLITLTACSIVGRQKRNIGYNVILSDHA